MKLLIVAAFMVVCGATTLYNGKNISVNDDGTILLVSSNGKKIVITHPTLHNGLKNVEINVSGPNMPTKTIFVDDHYYGKHIDYNTHNLYDDDVEMRIKRGSKDKKLSQIEILTDIFKQHQGMVDDNTYHNLLQLVHEAVLNGQIDNTIYNLLTRLNDNEVIERVQQVPTVRQTKHQLFNTIEGVAPSVHTWKHGGVYGDFHQTFDNVQPFEIRQNPYDNYNTFFKNFDVQQLERQQQLEQQQQQMYNNILGLKQGLYGYGVNKNVLDQYLLNNRGVQQPSTLHNIIDLILMLQNGLLQDNLYSQNYRPNGVVYDRQRNVPVNVNQYQFPYQYQGEFNRLGFGVNNQY